MPITGVVSDGQESIRKAVAKALDGVPHQLCHFHYLREAAKPISEADRHAKKELKKRVRGIRPIEQGGEGGGGGGGGGGGRRGSGGRAGLLRRGALALTDDGLPPLAAAGLKLHDRLSRIAASLDHVASLAGGLPGGLSRLRQLLRRGLEETAALWPPVREAYKSVHAWPVSSRTRRGCRRRRCGDGWCNCWGGCRAATTTGEPSVRAGLKQFLKVTRSYWPGLFRCYDAADLPRTNNDLEHTFGSHRYHERRSSGRRRASPGLVVMGSARVISGLATRLRPEEGLVLRPGYVEGWQALRAKLEAGASAAEAAALPP